MLCVCNCLTDISINLGYDLISFSYLFHHTFNTESCFKSRDTFLWMNFIETKKAAKKETYIYHIISTKLTINKHNEDIYKAKIIIMAQPTSG